MTNETISIKLKEESWQNIINNIKNNNILTQGNFWASIQSIEDQLDNKIINKDKLVIMFEMQKELQQNINKEKFGDLTFNQNYIDHMVIALIEEIMEAYRETPRKYWKINQTLNKEAFQEELIDSWHFMMNLFIAADISPQMLFDKYIQKNQINHERVKNGY